MYPKFTQLVDYCDTNLEVTYTSFSDVTHHPYGEGWAEESYSEFWIDEVRLASGNETEPVEITDPYLWAYLEEYVKDNHAEAGEEV